MSRKSGMTNQPATDKNAQALPQIDTVLVVDDDENWCYVTKLLLQDAGVGNRTLTAKNGMEALLALQALAARGEKLPELVFLDIKMPVMDGFEFLEELTKSAALDLSQTRIFMVTSSFLPKDRDRAARYPIAGFITKPLTEETIKDLLG